MYRLASIAFLTLSLTAFLACGQNNQAEYCRSGQLDLTLGEYQLAYCADEYLPATQTTSVFFKKSEVLPLHLNFNIKENQTPPEAEEGAEPTPEMVLVQKLLKKSSALLIVNTDEPGQFDSKQSFLSISQEETNLFHTPTRSDTLLNVSIDEVGDPGENITGTIEGTLNNAKRNMPVQISGTFEALLYGESEPKTRISMQ